MFSRSRPWRARGPSFGSAVGSRRRGRRTESLVATDVASVSGAFVADSADTAPALPIEATIVDEMLPIAPANLPVARIDESGLRALERRGHELAQIMPTDVSAPLDRLSPASLVRLLSQRADDSLAHPRSRRSA